MSNILPKKSWHVYNDDNREKVRRDEEAAQKLKDELQKKSAAADREHRLSILRAESGLTRQNNVQFLDFKESEQSVEAETEPEGRFQLFEFVQNNEKESAEKHVERRETQANKNPRNVGMEHLKDDPMNNFSTTEPDWSSRRLSKEPRVPPKNSGTRNSLELGGLAKKTSLMTRVNFPLKYGSQTNKSPKSRIAGRLSREARERERAEEILRRVKQNK